MSMDIREGDCREIMAAMPAGSVRCCVTSPPYWGLRDYGHPGQLGLERTPEEYVARMVDVFREVRRVLANDGTLWLNLGDSYSANRSYQVPDSKHRDVGNSKGMRAGNPEKNGGNSNRDGVTNADVAPKNLLGIPWRVAFALQADGWYLRSDIIWHKPNPMPESVTDRPTKAHEYLFLLAKSASYYYDAKAIAEPLRWPDEANRATPSVFGGRNKYLEAQKQSRLHSGNEYTGTDDGTRNRRSVWTVPTSPFKGAHFATFPPALIEPCILAGSRPGDIVLDPFMGSGTTAAVALQHGRAYLGCELNPDYKALQDERIAQTKSDSTINQLALPLEAMNAS